MSPPLILASGSPIRRQLLSEAGYVFEVIPADVDETALKNQLKDKSPDEIAGSLARAKAEAVSREHPGAYVIGSDQVACIDGLLLEKPASLEAACQSLARLEGRWHSQHTATSICKDGKPIFETKASARLLMKPLSPEAIVNYVRQDEPYGCVGAYRFEGLGREIFEQIVGETEVILGFNLSLILANIKQN